MRLLEVGRLNKRVKFFKFSEVEDDLGQSTNGLVLVGTYWCTLNPIRGSEFYELRKIESNVTHKCFVRWREALSSVDTNWFLEYDGKYYSVDYAMDIELAHELIEIRCTEHINKEDIIHE
jgi:SPP1 family predicted phage head-tail adaptor